ncbi:MAG: hypothetical protein ACRDTD_14470 [Pseudonocardiaceae bacterium]
MPSSELVRTFRDAGGGDKPAQGGMSAQTLPAPRDFEAVGELVTEEMVASTVACGPDPRRHLGMVGKHIDAGFDETTCIRLDRTRRRSSRAGRARCFPSSAEAAIWLRPPRLAGPA